VLADLAPWNCLEGLPVKSLFFRAARPPLSSFVEDGRGHVVTARCLVVVLLRLKAHLTSKTLALAEALLRLLGLVRVRVRDRARVKVRVRVGVRVGVKVLVLARVRVGVKVRVRVRARLRAGARARVRARVRVRVRVGFRVRDLVSLLGFFLLFDHRLNLLLLTLAVLVGRYWGDTRLRVRVRVRIRV
jgi:hypothetical protein